MSFNGVTIVADQQRQDAVRVLQEYNMQKQRGPVNQTLLNKAIYAGRLLQVDITQDQKIVADAQRNIVTLTAQEQQARGKMASLLQQVGTSVAQKEAEIVQLYPNPQEPRRIAVLQQAQVVKNSVADLIMKNQRGEKVNPAQLQTLYRNFISQIPSRQS